MRRSRQAMSAGGVVLALTAMTAGGMAAEQGDAGDVPDTAQVLDGAALVEGGLSPDDVDLFRVCVGDEGLAASTVGGTTLDTVLYVFDGDGRAVAKNDDTSSTWQSSISLGATAVPVGTYHVAVTGFGRQPASTMGTAMFGGGNQGEVQSADEVLGSWFGPHAQVGGYRLSLTGVVPCEDADAPLSLFLDVHPGSEAAVINGRSQGRTPMALLGADGLGMDALADGTIAAGPGSAAPAKVHLDDVDGDGVDDVVLHVPTQELGLAPGSQQLCVTVTLADGPGALGCETVEVR